MKAILYEYVDGNGNVSYSDSFHRDYDGRGCWELEVEIPDRLNPYISDFGYVCINPDNGFRCHINEILVKNREAPEISWYEYSKRQHYERLKVYSRKERSTALYL